MGIIKDYVRSIAHSEAVSVYEQKKPDGVGRDTTTTGSGLTEAAVREIVSELAREIAREEAEAAAGQGVITSGEAAQQSIADALAEYQRADETSLAEALDNHLSEHHRAEGIVGPVDPPEDTDLPDRDELYRVGEGFEFRSIQSAYDAIPKGGSGQIRITDYYDPAADAGGIEMLPDQEGDQLIPKAVTLIGQGQDVTQVGVEGATDDTIHYRGATAASYGRPFVAKDFTVVGAGGKRENGDCYAGVLLEGAPFAKLRDVIARTDGHGFQVREARRPDGAKLGSFNLLFDGCEAWNCDATGFNLSANANTHSSVLRSCAATACGEYGAKLRGTASAIRDGTYQLNYNLGIDARGGESMVIDGPYIEGNARKLDYPFEMYCRGAYGITIKDCYFNGINPRGARHSHRHVQLGLSIHDCEGYRFRDCTYKNYGERLVKTSNSTGSLHPDTHVARDETVFN